MATLPKGQRCVLLSLVANTQQIVTCEDDLPQVEVGKDTDGVVWFTANGDDVVIPTAGQFTTAWPLYGAVGALQIPPRTSGQTTIKVKSAAAATVYIVDPGRP